MRDIILMAIEAIFLISFLGWIVSAILFKSKAKKNHLEKQECAEIKEKVKKMKIWKVPSRIFFAIFVISCIVVIIGALLFVLYAIYMLVMFVISLVVAVMSHAKTETKDALDFIWNYWKYCGIWGFPGLLVSATYYMVKQFHISRVKIKLLKEKISEL